MLTAIQKRLNYANVAATVALVFSMSGVAIAAKHYLINSTKQINPKVIRQLRGHNGTNGTPGAAGAKGEKGATGPAGANGTNGTPGAAGPNGEKGATGPAGPSNGYGTSERSYEPRSSETLSKSLPAGKYVITAVLDAYLTGTASEEIDCLDSGPNTAPFAILAPQTAAPLSDTWTQTLSSPGTVSFECHKVHSEPVYMGYGSLTAVKVETLG